MFREHGARVGQQRAVGRKRGQVRQRAADIAGNEVEQRFGRRREQADVQVHVEEDRRDIGAVQHILQIVGGGPLAVERFLELAVERGQFLVERLQFLLRGEQLLIGRLEFLVDRQRLLVDRLLLLARDLQIADGALQFRSRRLQLLFEFGDARNLSGRDGAAFAALLPGFVIEETDQRQFLAVAQNRTAQTG